MTGNRGYCNKWEVIGLECLFLFQFGEKWLMGRCGMIRELGRWPAGDSECKSFDHMSKNQSGLNEWLWGSRGRWLFANESKTRRQLWIYHRKLKVDHLTCEVLCLVDGCCIGNVERVVEKSCEFMSSRLFIIKIAMRRRTTWWQAGEERVLPDSQFLIFFPLYFDWASLLPRG